MKLSMYRFILAAICLLTVQQACAAFVTFVCRGDYYGTFRLTADVDGYTTHVRDFVPDLGALEVFYEGDFDGDGTDEGILREYDPSDNYQSQFWLMKHQGGTKFKIYKMFSHYGTVRPGRRGGRAVLEVLDDGVVTARYGFTGSSVKNYGGDIVEPEPTVDDRSSWSDRPRSRDSRSSRGKTFHIDSDYRGQIYFDFNGDGSVDKLYDFNVSSSSLRCKLNMNGHDYEVYAPISGAPVKINILKQRTKGMNNLLVTGADGSRYRICWNGSSYR